MIYGCFRDYVRIGMMMPEGAWNFGSRYIYSSYIVIFNIIRYNNSVVLYLKRLKDKIYNVKPEFRLIRKGMVDKMKFCTQCGTQLEDNHRFCIKCGAKQEILQVSMPPQPQQVYVQPQEPQQVYPQPPMQQAYEQPQPEYYQPMPDVDLCQMQYQMTGMDFSRIKARYRCANGHVFDGNDQTCTCPTCQVPLQKDAYIQLYRQGNFMGCAVGMGIYLNNVPYGHISNKGSVKIYLPFGQYMIHVTHTATRNCNDPIITLTPQQPVVYTKARFTSAGFSITVDEAAPQDMPTK